MENMAIEVELEYKMLGTCMIYDCFYKVDAILNENCFSNRLTKGIYFCLKELHNEGGSMNIVALQERFNKKVGLKSGDMLEFSKMYQLATTDHRIEYFARVLMQYAIDRQLKEFGANLYQNAGKGDALEALDVAQSDLHKIANMAIQGKVSKFDDDVVSVVETIGKRMNGVNVLGIPTNLKDLDLVLGGWKAPDLIILAARPAMGKTAFALHIARQSAKHHKEGVTAVFSLEMSKEQLIERLVVSESMIDNEQIKRGKLSQDEYTKVMQAGSDIMQMPICIDDTPAVTVSYIRSVCMKLQHEKGLNMIVVDYLQLMTDPAFKGNATGEVTAISKGLKAIAKSLNVPVVALSQLSRAVETRGGDKKPQLSDLRDSGSIEQDADIVIFLHRPEYYGITQDEEGNSVEGMTNVIVAKYRNGMVGTVPVRFKGKYFAFSDWNNGSEAFNEPTFLPIKNNGIELTPNF